MFPICQGDLEGHLHTPYGMGSCREHQYICQTFLCLLVHPFTPQFITVIPIAPHHCGLLLNWTGCPWMYDWLLFQSCASHHYYLYWCLLWCMLPAFRLNAGCHIHMGVQSLGFAPLQAFGAYPSHTRNALSGCSPTALSRGNLLLLN